jgi:effector-binding domain-containing protein
MLTLHKAQVEQQMLAAASRIRAIESRLRSIEESPDPARHDIVVKAVPEQEMLGLRVRLPLDDATRLGGRMVRALSARIEDRRLLGPFGAVMHNNFMDADEVDVEMGYFVTHTPLQPVALDDRTMLAIRPIPAVETMATFVVVGPVEYSHLGYSAIGAWMEANRYQVAGPTREVMLRPRRKMTMRLSRKFNFPSRRSIKENNMIGPSATTLARHLQPFAYMPGEWNVITHGYDDQGMWRQGNPTRSVIVPVLEGRFLEESVVYETPSRVMRLRIVRSFDPFQKCYRISICDAEYGMLDVYEGRFEGGVLTASDEHTGTHFRLPGGKHYMFNLIQHAEDDNHFSVAFDASSDGGQTWGKFSSSEYTRAHS